MNCFISTAMRTLMAMCSDCNVKFSFDIEISTVKLESPHFEWVFFLPSMRPPWS